LGAFLGRRVSYGSAGALTAFISLGVGSVKLSSSQSSQTAQALLGSIGAMMDLGSSTNGFKFGLVFGHDRLSAADNANYAHRKPWLGFEFAYNKPGN
jgi:hypothetical protein